MNNYFDLGQLQPSVATSTGLTTTFHTLAFVTTSLRLFHRFRRQRVGWDDFWAGVADLFALMIFTLFLLSGVIFGKNVPISVQTFGISPRGRYGHSSRCSKISIAVTLARLLGDGRFRSIAKGVAAAFGVVGIALSIGRIFRCGTDFSTPPFCPTPRYTAYMELVFDILGDVWVIGAPLCMLKRVRLPRQHQRLLGCVFLCGLFTTFASIIHYGFILTREIIVGALTAHIQLCVSIITCNLLVLATYVYRKVHEGLNETTERTQTPDPSSNGQGRLATPLTVIHSHGRETRGSRPGGVSVERSRPSVPLGSHSTHVTLTELGSSMLDGLDTTFDNGSSGSNYADTRHHSNADPEQISPGNINCRRPSPGPGSPDESLVTDFAYACKLGNTVLAKACGSSRLDRSPYLQSTLVGKKFAVPVAQFGTLQ
ncbi:hypothetical protein BJ165DRAFT_1526334 [Panaeolus papilionaceus]|nr:hypothetical protein BJ165DRAFT_1526334 [Panaeolus papilionaceus]